VFKQSTIRFCNKAAASQHGLTVKIRARRWLLSLCAIACLVCGMPRTLKAQYSDAGSIDRGYQLKALFIYNFGSYVDWPATAFADAKSPFVIGVVGTTALDATLNQIAQTKKIKDRHIVIRRFATAAEVKPCQILFVSNSISADQRRRIIEQFRNEPVLLVGESRGFADSGGSVNFFDEANKMRFEINLEAAKQRQLKISSKLLSMAKIVQTVAGVPAR
jgi:hypothetical protein